MNVIAAFDENAIIWITLYMGKHDRPPPPTPHYHLHLPFNSAMRPPQLCREQVAFHKASVLLLIGKAWRQPHVDKG